MNDIELRISSVSNIFPKCRNILCSNSFILLFQEKEMRFLVQGNKIFLLIKTYIKINKLINNSELKEPFSTQKHATCNLTKNQYP